MSFVHHGLLTPLPPLLFIALPFSGKWVVAVVGTFSTQKGGASLAVKCNKEPQSGLEKKNEIGGEGGKNIGWRQLFVLKERRSRQKG